VLVLCDAPAMEWFRKRLDLSSLGQGGSKSLRNG